MNKQQPSIALELVVSNEKAIAAKAPKSLPDNFIQKMLHHPDAVRAADLVAEQVVLKYARSIAELKIAVEDKARQCTAALAKLTQLEERIQNTDAIKAKASENSIPWSQWETAPKILMCFTVLLMLLAMIMGWANVYANLMASGSPTFLDDPRLAAAIATIMPIASATIKYVTYILPSQRDRRRYAIGIFTLTILAIATWAILFAIEFPGVSSTIVWDDLGESNTSGSALVWAQVCVELLCAASLFLAAEILYQKYSPDAYGETEEVIEARRVLAKYRPEYDQMLAEGKALTGELADIEATSHREKNYAIADFMALRAKHAGT